MRLLIFSCLVTLSLFVALGQENVAAWESNVALNYPMKNWKLHTSIAHRSLQTKVLENKRTRLAFVEANQFFTRKIGANIRLSLGYKYRDIEPTRRLAEVEQRLTQQLTIAHTRDRLRLASRFRSEQRFQITHFTHRYRYRISIDMPLSGRVLDENEFYLLVSNETLLEIDSESHEWDNRITWGLGYVFSSFTKAQLDYTLRSEGINASLDHVSFITTSLIMNLNR